MAAASPRSTQLPPGSEIPGGLACGFARGDRDDVGCVAVGVGLAAADPVAVGAGGAMTPSSGWVGVAVGGAGVAGADGGGLGCTDGPGGVGGPVDGAPAAAAAVRAALVVGWAG